MKTHCKSALIRATVVLVAAAITGCTSAPADNRERQTSAETFGEPPVVASKAGTGTRSGDTARAAAVMMRRVARRFEGAGVRPAWAL